MKPRDLRFEIMGWYGAGAIVLAYALVSFELLSPLSLWYQILNGTGAIGIVIDSIWHHRAYPAGVLNIIWTIIAIIALVRIILL